MNTIYLRKMCSGVNAYSSMQNAAANISRIGCWPNYYSNCPDQRYKYVNLNCNKYKIVWVTSCQ